MKIYHFLFALILITQIWGCKGVRQGNLLKSNAHFVPSSIGYKQTENSSDSIEFMYSGCAGFYIKYHQSGLLHDIYLSNQGPLLSLLFKKIGSNKDLVDNYFKRAELNDEKNNGTIKAILTSHTHYDHALDLPLIYQKLNPDSLFIVANPSLKKIFADISIKNFIKTDSSNASFGNIIGSQYLSADNQFLITPIIAEHAPHFHKIRFFDGAIKKKIVSPSKARFYRGDQSLSYIVDILDKKRKKPIYRIFIQGSSSNAPNGFPPQVLLKQKAVDLAILCVASYKYVANHPQKIIEYISPKLIIFSHYENFFQTHEKLEKKIMTVPFTNTNKFFEKVSTIQKKQQERGLGFEYFVPNIYSIAKINF